LKDDRRDEGEAGIAIKKKLTADKVIASFTYVLTKATTGVHHSTIKDVTA
jgi:hypothetical protein